MKKYSIIRSITAVYPNPGKELLTLHPGTAMVWWIQEESGDWAEDLRAEGDKYFKLAAY